MPVFMLLVCLTIVGTAEPSPTHTPLGEQVDRPRASPIRDSNVFETQHSILDLCGELGAFGGNGGEVFDDSCNPELYITELELAIGPLGNCSKCLRYIRATYSDGTKSPEHGTYDGPDTTFYLIVLSESERLFGAVVRYGEYVDQITFISGSASVPFNVVGPFGESTRRALLKNGATFAEEIKGFYGHSGIGIHRLGFKGPLYP